jgi:hypothetical protein
MRSAQGLRKLMVGERSEYDPIDSWAGAFNELIDLWAAPSSPYVEVINYVELTVTANTKIDERPATPTGPGRWMLVSVTCRLEVAITGAGSPSATFAIGSTEGGAEIVKAQTITSATTVGTIVGGFAIASLGTTDMAQANGFEGMYPAGQETWAAVVATNAPATGTVKIIEIWMAL